MTAGSVIRLLGVVVSKLGRKRRRGTVRIVWETPVLFKTKMELRWKRPQVAGSSQVSVPPAGLLHK